MGSLILGVLVGVAIGNLAAFLVFCCCQLAGLADDRAAELAADVAEPQNAEVSEPLARLDLFDADAYTVIRSAGFSPLRDWWPLPREADDGVG